MSSGRLMLFVRYSRIRRCPMNSNKCSEKGNCPGSFLSCYFFKGMLKLVHIELGACHAYGCLPGKISREDLRIWYDGYHTMAGERVYNPRSVVLALMNNNLGNILTGGRMTQSSWS